MKQEKMPRSGPTTQEGIYFPTNANGEAIRSDTQGVKSPKSKDPMGKDIKSPSLSWKRRARAIHAAGTHTVPLKPMGK